MPEMVHIELSVEEMCQLSEMCAMTLSLLEPMDAELSYDARYHAWKKLSIGILDAASKIPNIAPLMELNRDCGYYFFTQHYVQNSFYAPLLLRLQENVFWSEFVKRLSDRVFGTAPLSPLDSQQRAIYEHALWTEVEHNGLNRFRITLN